MKPNARKFCLLPEFVNVRGDECVNCTVLIGYGWAPGTTLYMNSYYSPDGELDFGGGITNEAKFGFYETDNPNFRYTSLMSSTTQFWLERF